MHNIDISGNEYVRNKPAMATPPQQFGAHHHRAQPIRAHEQLHKTTRELLGCEVIGVSAKGGMPPRVVA
jgi:hypothetical protein